MLTQRPSRRYLPASNLPAPENSPKQQIGLHHKEELLRRRIYECAAPEVFLTHAPTPGLQKQAKLLERTDVDAEK